MSLGDFLQYFPNRVENLVNMVLLNDQGWRKGDNIASRPDHQAFLVTFEKGVERPGRWLAGDRFKFNRPDKAQISQVNDMRLAIQ